MNMRNTPGKLTPEQVELMNKYEIALENEKYVFQTYKYDELQDAIDYAQLCEKKGIRFEKPSAEADGEPNGVNTAPHEELLEIQNKIKGIVISTGDIKRDYDIIDVVFAIDSADEGLLGALMLATIKMSFGADPGKAFVKVKDQLRYQCHQLGGNAVINCLFEHRVAASRGIGGSGIGVTQTVEIFAYGTAVKFKQ